MPPEQFEVIVVDDGSTDNTQQVVDTFRSMLRIQYAYQENSGLASGKNHGLFLARGAIILFLDDDVVADSRLLEEHYRCHQEFPEQHYAVLGYTDLTATVARSPLMRYVTEVGCYLFSYPSLTDRDSLDFSYFWGGRSSCKRAFLLEAGIFNPIFRFGAEDIELGYRLSGAGLQVIFNKKAVSHMTRTLDFDAFCHRCFLQGRSNWLLSQLHPDCAVRTWARVEGVLDQWATIQPRYDLIMKMSRELDQLVRERAGTDGSLDEIDTKLLYRAYGAAFDANRIKGSATIQLEEHQA